MNMHYWEKTVRYGFPAFRCGWCGLVIIVPRIVRNFRSIKPDDDNFDITCALSQGVEIGTEEYMELHNCPIGDDKRKRFNMDIEEVETLSKEAEARFLEV